MSLSAAELAMVLLFSPMDCGEELRPLNLTEYKALALKVAAKDKSGQTLFKELDTADFLDLGYDESESTRLFKLFNREKRIKLRLRELSRLGIYPISRISSDYPSRFRRLKGSAPPLLFAAGRAELLGSKCVSLVGSRRLDNDSAAFSAKVGELAAKNGLTLVSGGAQGADREAEHAALRNGGSVISILPGSLISRLEYSPVKTAIADGSLLLLALRSPVEAFSSGRAMERNRYIHMLGEKTFVAQCSYGEGGSWAGSVDNLKKSWSELYVNDDGSRGSRELIKLGAAGVKAGELDRLISS